jgi:hypothetical protein
MTRTRLGLALSAAVLGLSGLVGLPASAAAQPSPSPPEPTPSETSPSEIAPPSDNGHNDMGLGNILHGEGVIKTKGGTQPVAMQHGTVTAVSDSSITLKSSDGYTKTWSLNDSVHVVEHRKTLQPNSIKVGSDLIVAGPRQGTTFTASIVIVHD